MADQRSIDIEIVDVDVQEPVPGKKYSMANVTFKNEYQGKVTVTGRKVMDFAIGEEGWALLKKAVKGERYSVDQEKTPDGKFWNWIGIHRQDGAAPMASASPAPNRGNYETADERALRQQMIIRQSSLGHAIAFHNGGAPGEKALAQILATAQMFVDFVNGDVE